MAYWNLYWVESNGIEDCFVVARNSQSARRVEYDMNGFDPEDVNATKILRIPPSVEKSYLRQKQKEGKENFSWPWYGYRDLFSELGVQFRIINGVEEMLVDDTVYSWSSKGPKRLRSIGKKALLELKNMPDFSYVENDEEDAWEPSQLHLLTMLGICVARCQQIEFYISHSFLLGISKKQKRKYRTINDLKNGWKRKTLGTLLRHIDEAYEIEPIVRASFNLFLDMRNHLVHGITTSEQYNIETSWGQDELVAFLTFFDKISRNVRNAFRSSYYASIKFGMEFLDSEEKVPKDVLSQKQIDEIGLFAEFFIPIKGCI